MVDDGVRDGDGTSGVAVGVGLGWLASKMPMPIVTIMVMTTIAPMMAMGFLLKRFQTVSGCDLAAGFGLDRVFSAAAGRPAVSFPRERFVFLGTSLSKSKDCCNYLPQ